jgi:uncharacterized protein (UPF0335 family)
MQSPVFEKGYPDYDAVNRMGDLKFTTAGDMLMQQEADNTAANEIRSFIERLETLEAEKSEVMDQMKDVLSEAKGRGYETKVLKKIVAIRKRNRDDVENENAMTEMYMNALGM